MFISNIDLTNQIKSKQVQISTQQKQKIVNGSAQNVNDVYEQFIQQHFSQEKQTSHLYSIAYGFDMQMTDKRMEKDILDSSPIPKFQLTQQVKQFFDTLYDYDVSPSKQFEKFLIAVNSIMIAQKMIGYVEEIEENEEKDEKDSNQNKTETQQSNLDSSIVQNEQINTSIISSVIELNNDDKRQTHKDKTQQIEQYDLTTTYQLQLLCSNLMQNIQWLLEYIKACRQCVPCFYTHFGEIISLYMLNLFTEKDIRDLQQEQACQFFKEKVSKFILNYINTDIISSANQIYQILTQQFSPTNHILIYSASKLIINSVIIYNDYLKKTKQQNNFQVSLIYTDDLIQKQQLQKLISNNVKVNYINLSNLPYFLQQQHPTIMLVGCQEISKNANVVSRIGCSAAAIFCHQCHIPIIAVAETYKFGGQENRQGNGIDIIESIYLQAIICENGVLSCQSIRTRCM